MAKTATKPELRSERGDDSASPAAGSSPPSIAEANGSSKPVANSAIAQASTSQPPVPKSVPEFQPNSKVLAPPPESVAVVQAPSVAPPQETWEKPILGNLPMGAGIPSADAEFTDPNLPADDNVAATNASLAEDSYGGRFQRWIKQEVPATLTSLIIHLILILVAVIWTIGQPPDRGPTVAVEPALGGPSESTEFAISPAVASPAAADTADQLDSPSSEFTADSMSTEAVQTVEMLTLSPTGEASSSAAAAAPADSSSATKAEIANLLSQSGQSFIPDVFRPTDVAGRTGDQRLKLALERGGSKETEFAVEQALKWLAKHQNPDGSWSLDHTGHDCGGQCPNPGGPPGNEIAATGLSLLAFLGAGYTHQEGKYADEVRRGIYYLKQSMEESPSGMSLAGGVDFRMYNHGIATLALSEAYQMTQDKELLHDTRQCLVFSMAAQNSMGSWGYTPNSAGDITISSWQIMSLKSGKAAGLDIPVGPIILFDGYLETQQTENGAFYGYRAPGKLPGPTAMGLLMRMYRGWSRTDPRLIEGVRYLHSLGPSDHDVYFNYYAMQTLYHFGGPDWPKWNKKLRDHLIKNQETRGHAEGSWYFSDVHARVGGRVYCTAMSAMALEVYYRYAPIYEAVENDAFEL